MYSITDLTKAALTILLVVIAAGELFLANPPDTKTAMELITVAVGIYAGGTLIRQARELKK